MKQIKSAILSVATMAMVALSMSVNSATIAYSEFVSGDLSGAGSLTSLNLVTGQNQVSGTDANSDLDGFAFIVPNGSVLTEISVQTFHPERFGAGWSLFAGSADAFVGTFVDQLLLSLSSVSASDSIGAQFLPLAAGTYNITPVFGFGSADYIFSLTVIPTNHVPVPASLALLALGLAGIGFSRR